MDKEALDKEALDKETLDHQRLDDSVASPLRSAGDQEPDQAESETHGAAHAGRAQRKMQTLLATLGRADADAAAARVARLKADHPEAVADQLVRHLIARAGRQTALVGAASAGVALVPGIGPLAAATLGTTADLTATFKIQAEMALEIALVRGVALNEVRRQRLIVLVTGISTGSNVLLNQAGQQLAQRLGRRWAGRSLVKGLPIFGIAVSSATNVLMTYLIGLRADAYFSGGTVPSWRDGLRALSGVDERRLTRWLAEGGRWLGAGLDPQRRLKARKQRLAERTRLAVDRLEPA